MIVVEIGCGPNAGPFIDGATEHFIVDQDEDAVRTAMRFDDRFTPLVGCDAGDLPFENQSIDIVLARNVFGDELLGLSKNTKAMAILLPLALMADGNMVGFQEITTRTSAYSAYERKIRLLTEASRILTSQGSMFIVEQYTPSVAEEFFTRLEQDPDQQTDLVFSRQNGDTRLPSSYTEKRLRSPYDTLFVGKKTS